VTGVQMCALPIYFSWLILNNVSLSGLFVVQGFGGGAALGIG